MVAPATSGHLRWALSSLERYARKNRVCHVSLSKLLYKLRLVRHVLALISCMGPHTVAQIPCIWWLPARHVVLYCRHPDREDSPPPLLSNYLDVSKGVEKVWAQEVLNLKVRWECRAPMDAT